MNQNTIRIAVEGHCNSGKTTLARHVAQFLKLTGWNVEFDEGVQTESKEPPREHEAKAVEYVRGRTLVMFEERSLNRGAVPLNSEGPDGGKQHCTGILEFREMWGRNCKIWDRNTNGCFDCQYHRDF